MTDLCATQTPAQLQVAAAQYNFDQLADMAAWRTKVANWVRDGAATGAALLVFPEYAAVDMASAFGADIAGDVTATLKAVAEAAPERIALHQELAAQHNVHILAGSGPAYAPASGIVNEAHLITPSGKVGTQAKMMMTPFEVEWGITGGRQVRVFDTALGRCGIAICYDSEFPLIVRAMAVAGVDFVMIPSCTERISGYYRVRTGARARALENQIAAITSPTVGEAPWSPIVDVNAGAAGVFVPSEHTVSDTGVLVEGGINAPGWVTAIINFAPLQRLRATGEMRNFADWGHQPGGTTDIPAAEVVDLRD